MSTSKSILVVFGTIAFLSVALFLAAQQLSLVERL
jgi:preprotein translocase subunit SecE